MPQISLVSDLHLELARAPALKGGGILLLAGDIWTAAHVENRGAARHRFEAFCKTEPKKYGLIFLVQGNHEYYGSTLEAAPRIIEELLEEHAPQTIVLTRLAQGWRRARGRQHRFAPRAAVASGQC